jgi:hypothetical protein
MYSEIAEKAVNRVDLYVMKNILKILTNFSIFGNNNLLNDREIHFSDKNFEGTEILIPDIMLE